MPKLKSYAVFISHAWAYSADYYRLEKMLDKAKHFKWRNCSVPKHDKLDTRTDAQLTKALRRQIKPASAVLIISGMYVNNREWIQKEIDIALEMKKKIIPLRPRGAQRIPEELGKIAPPINWNTTHIVESIRGRAALVQPEKSSVVKSAKPSQGTPSERWNDLITSSPDFSSLRDWIKNQDERTVPSFDKRGKNIERRRGMHG